MDSLQGSDANRKKLEVFTEIARSSSESSIMNSIMDKFNLMPNKHLMIQRSTKLFQVLSVTCSDPQIALSIINDINVSKVTRTDISGIFLNFANRFRDNPEINYAILSNIAKVSTQDEELILIQQIEINNSDDSVKLELQNMRNNFLY